MFTWTNVCVYCIHMYMLVRVCVYIASISLFSPIGWGCRIHQLHLYRVGKTHTHTHINECPGYDTKQSDGQVPVMLGLWGM